MIKLEKLEEPEILKANAEEWTREYLQYIKSGVKVPKSVIERYSNKDIKNQLLKETYRKCAYCESKFTHVSSGDIEHILSKNKDSHPELYVSWSNLIKACESCNRSGKKSYNNDNEHLLNPYTDEIDNEISCAGAMICAQLGSRKGKISIDVLNLNRVELLERRYEKLEKLDLLIMKYAEEKNGDYKNILLEQIWEETGKDKEYSFILSKFCEGRGIRRVHNDALLID